MSCFQLSIFWTLDNPEHKLYNLTLYLIMRSLALFFIRYNGFFLFVLLEMIAISLMVKERNNPKHHEAFISSSNYVIGSIDERVNRFWRYWNLSSVNDSLAQENARLYEQLRSAYFDGKLQQDTLRDSTLIARYHYIEAEVVDNSTGRLDNYITLNRGSNHGIKPNMGVINGTGAGILGVVRYVSRNYSTVMSVLHRDTRISAKLQRNNTFGTLTWNGVSPRRMILEAIPKHTKVLRGDTIVTSGFSGIFPKDIMIGVVDTFRLESGSNFYTIDVMLSSDLSNAQYGFVVDDLMHDELEQLQEQTNNDK